MKRLEGWEKQLADYLEERKTMSFKWGSHDCCRFACSGLVVQGLPNPMSESPVYKTAAAAARAVRYLGKVSGLGMDVTLDDVAPILAQNVGLHEVKPAFAGRGCVVLASIEIPSGKIEPALGLVGLDGTHAMFAGLEGLVERHLSDCYRAWGFN